MTIRPYDHDADYEAVNRFLVGLYRPVDVLENWLQPRWEYMHFHPMSIGLPFDRCGVSEDEVINGLVHFEATPAFNYLQYRPGNIDVVEALLDWSTDHLGGHSETFDRDVLGFYVNDFDQNVRHLMEERGFEQHHEHAEPHAQMVLTGPVDVPPLPDGFRLVGLDEDNDLARINEVLWRGFNHAGLPPDEEIPGRANAQQAPNFRKDLTIVVLAPNGDYATFAGMWVVPENKVAYVEPVATDPRYRRMGLGRAAVLESIRRAGADGAEVVWVGSDQPFYLDMGFAVQCRSSLWVKTIG